MEKRAETGKTIKMVIAVVHDNDAADLLEALTAEGFQATKLASTGGFLREGNTTFIIGSDREHVDDVLAIIKEQCEARSKTVAPMSPVANSLEGYYSFPMEIKIGGATVFIIDVEQFVKL